jgi:hypothetical protein
MLHSDVIGLEKAFNLLYHNLKNNKSSDNFQKGIVEQSDVNHNEQPPFV